MSELNYKSTQVNMGSGSYLDPCIMGSLLRPDCPCKGARAQSANALPLFLIMIQAPHNCHRNICIGWCCPFFSPVSESSNKLFQLNPTKS